MREPGCIVPIPNRRQALNQVARVLSQTGKYPRGICRFCGCTDDNACISKESAPCSWLDQEQTVCTAPYCQTSFNMWKEAQAHAASMQTMQ